MEIPQVAFSLVFLGIIIAQKITNINDFTLLMHHICIQLKYNSSYNIYISLYSALIGYHIYHNVDIENKLEQNIVKCNYLFQNIKNFIASMSWKYSTYNVETFNFKEINKVIKVVINHYTTLRKYNKPPALSLIIEGIYMAKKELQNKSKITYIDFIVHLESVIYTPLSFATPSIDDNIMYLLLFYTLVNLCDETIDKLNEISYPSIIKDQEKCIYILIDILEKMD